MAFASARSGHSPTAAATKGAPASKVRRVILILVSAVLSFMFASERMLRSTLIRLVRPYLEGATVEPRTAAECFSKNSQRSANG